MSDLAFRTEEDRTKAIEAISMTPPKGTSQEDWADQVDAQMDAIFAAPIDGGAALAVDDGAGAPAAAAAPDEDIHAARRKALEGELAQERAENAKKRKELEDQLAAARAVTAAPAPAAAPAFGSDAMQKVEAEINDLSAALEAVDDVLDDSDHVKKMQRLTLLNAKYNAMVRKNYEAESKARTEADATRQKEAQAAADKDASTRAEEERMKKVVQNIEDFRSGRKEYNTGKTFDKMSEEWAGFATEVASVWNGKRPAPGDSDALEAAMAKYLNGVPSLMEELKKRGIKEPSGMRVYMDLTEIDLLAQGYVQDAATGAWKELKSAHGQKVTFPSHEDAEAYFKKMKGISGRERVDAGRASSQSSRDAQGRRVHPIELGEADRGGGADLDMTEDEMQAALDAFSEKEISILYHKNPEHPRIMEYDKLCTKLGLPTAAELLGEE